MAASHGCVRISRSQTRTLIRFRQHDKGSSLSRYHWGRKRVDLRREQEFAERAVEESDTGLWYKDNQNLNRKSNIDKKITQSLTYTEDKNTSHDGGVLGMSDFIVGGTQKALLLVSRNDALSGSHCEDVKSEGAIQKWSTSPDVMLAYRDKAGVTILRLRKWK